MKQEGEGYHMMPRSLTSKMAVKYHPEKKVS